MGRKSVAQYRVGQEVSVSGQPGRWFIAGFPTRRLAVVRQGGSGAQQVETVSIRDLAILQPEGPA